MLVLAGLLAATAGLAGCGGGGGAGQRVQIVVGYCGDWTGPAAPGAAEYGGAFLDYFKMIEAEDPIPGVKIVIKTYDTRSDYSRIPIGYEWLKGQGMKLFFAPSPADIDVSYNKLEADQIPGFGTTSLDSRKNATWAFWAFATFEDQNGAIMKWIMTQDWDYQAKGRNPKVALVGWSGLISTIASVDGVEQYIAANPGKFDWQGSYLAPTGTINWVSEASKLKDCDYIFMGTIGSGTAAFIKESRARGYAGAIVNCSATLTGWWNLVTASVPADNLTNLYQWTDIPWCWDNPYYQYCQTLALKYHSQDWWTAAARQSSYFSGPSWGMIITEGIKKAIEQVGAANLDGPSIRDGLESVNIDMTADGWGVPWVFGPSNHIANGAIGKIFKWNLQSQKWDAVTDWFAP